MKPFAESFYKSQAWKKCRAAYAKYRGGLCESCFADGIITPGVIVHHKVHITPANIHAKHSMKGQFFDGAGDLTHCKVTVNLQEYLNW